MCPHWRKIGPVAGYRRSTSSTRQSAVIRSAMSVPPGNPPSTVVQGRELVSPLARRVSAGGGGRAVVEAVTSLPVRVEIGRRQRDRRRLSGLEAGRGRNDRARPEDLAEVVAELHAHANGADGPRAGVLDDGHVPHGAPPRR